ncbi:MAG: ABC transporter ATP-binding protein/permease, partial [Methyloceanibacter sp.]
MLLTTVISLQLFQVWLNVRFNAWYNTFYTALQDKDWNTFIYQIWVFSVLAAFFIVSAVYQLYLQQWLQIRWRNWLTKRYVGRWLGQGTHYRMRLKGDQADNPDQRIADDIREFVDSTLNIGIALLGSIVTLVSFVVILWTLSSTTPLMIGSSSFQIPGYLVWAALIYAVIGTWVTHLVGRPLIKLNFDQQRYEADFRFSLVRLRENAEEVTLLAGEPAEEERLRDRFGWVIRNWYDIMRRRKRLTFLTSGYSQVAIIFPFLVVSPVYFFGALTLGGLMQIVSAFGQVQSALSFFVTAYTSIADWKAVLNRLAGFEASMKWAQGLDQTAPRLEALSNGGTALVVDKLAVGLPNGQEIVRLSGLTIEPGERVLVTGPSGAGKTSLFRALGGVWPFGSGSIRVPKGASVLVLPQRTYLPLGTLRGALAYPGSTDTFTQGEIEEVLGAVRLA